MAKRMQAKFQLLHTTCYSFSHLAAKCCKRLEGVTGRLNVFDIAAIYWDEMLRALGRALVE